eukprot:m.39577 g.39577  ORF g.39577 m.39577 type:complete len:51 (-) comp11623_c0_seq1:188-340(-)
MSSRSPLPTAPIDYLWMSSDRLPFRVDIAWLTSLILLASLTSSHLDLISS